MPKILTDEDRAAILALKEMFSFDEKPKQAPSKIIIIAGPEGVGKSHLALTSFKWGKPVYHLDTEGRGHYLTDKAPFKGNIAGSKKIAPGPRAYYELLASMSYINSLPATREKGAVIVLDSGTDLQTFAELKYLEDEDKMVVGKAYNWGKIFAWCSYVLKTCRQANLDLIMTARVKPEYVGEDVKSGKMDPRVWKEAPHIADYIFQFNEKGELNCKKNSAWDKKDHELSRNMTLPDIIKLLEQKPEANG